MGGTLRDPYGNAYTVGSATGAKAVTPNDDADLPNGICRGIYVGGAGNVAITTASGDDIVLEALQVGVVHPISVKRVKATLTTATKIVAVY